ncbi:MAG TPA: hypothetical protein VEY91_03370 [Candidatus Limnocylindria bacterium]|nr:hypothetical protein [Candidatus Limnocylindria bacterium]
MKSLLMLSSLAALVLGVEFPFGCRPATRDVSRAERAVLKRQVEELERLVVLGRSGPLIPFDQALVVIDQSLLQDLLVAVLPYETVVSGRIRIRILEATVSCEDGLALVHLRGRASLKGQPEESAFVEANVYGSLREFDLKREESVLRGRVDVIAFDMRRVKLVDDDHEAVKELLRDVAEIQLGAFRGMDYAFDIPVRLVRDIVLPEFQSEGGIRIPEARVPLQASVTAVTALRQKLWISIRLYDELKASGRPRAVATATETAR